MLIRVENLKVSSEPFQKPKVKARLELAVRYLFGFRSIHLYGLRSDPYTGRIDTMWILTLEGSIPVPSSVSDPYMVWNTGMDLRSDSYTGILYAVSGAPLNPKP